MSELKNNIQTSMKTAMRGKDKDALKTIRMLMAAIKQDEIDNQIEITDSKILAITAKMIKQRQESIKQYTEGGRPELAQIERDEIVILQQFLPPALSEDEVISKVKAAIESTGASSVRDMGNVMNSLRSELQGRADMAMVSQIVKSQLA